MYDLEANREVDDWSEFHQQAAVLFILERWGKRVSQ